MSFQLSSGTLDKLAGVYAPPRKHRPGSGGGRAKGATTGGSAIALLLPKGGAGRADFTTSPQLKHAFGSGAQERVSDRAIRTLERTARGVPEVMVRVTGRQTGSGHVLANFAYISRLGHGAGKELALHTSEEDVLRDGRDMQILAQDWHEWEMGGDGRRKGATSISMILSMPAGTDPERLQEAALDFARTEFANRSWVASLHVDRDHPHVHLTIARRDLDGRRFNPDRDDLFRYRQRFAQKLRVRGIEANATPARARGIDPVHEPIAARKVRAKGEVPRIDKSRTERAARLREQGVIDPAQAALARRHASIRSAHIQAFALLSQSPNVADQFVAQSVEKFVMAMPSPEPNSARAVRLAREQEAERAAARVRARFSDLAKPLSDTGISRLQALSDKLKARAPSAAPSMRADQQQPAKPQGPAEPRGISRPDHLPESTNRRDLAGAIQLYARAVVDVAGMQKRGLPVLPHQLAALEQTSEALDAIRYNGLRHFVTAIERNPMLVHDAAAGDVRGSLEAMAVEAQVDQDPKLRAERFMERWWKVEIERSLGDPMVRILRGHMVDDLYHDPALRDELERCAPELGLKRSEHPTPEQMLQRWLLEMDRDRERQQDRGGPGR
ncbi:hypothetical protein FHT00_003471 [Sphingomonas insulae]|uniref:MobA/VirD2-like nuclease domain-containing protein n=1 Tax=Sphingomonas insulae TaxID=424800 RepID=A0ABN1HPD2_9SPHN|nr:relaxase/mobilization nuclease domain-containing protein [Sphingomonas insulae]NIJ31491.1 hypothetical protein [Sphingomonas insulae]